jgi:hypothetical protein
LAFSWIRQTLVSYWRKTCCFTHHTFLLGFPTGWWFTSTVPPQAAVSSAMCFIFRSSELPYMIKIIYV